MNKEAIKNIKNTFEANPDVQHFYANEAGHCFANNLEGLTLIERANLSKLKADGDDKESSEDSSEEKQPSDMTVAELKAKLTEMEVEFAANANKATLVELLTAATNQG